LIINRFFVIFEDYFTHKSLLDMKKTIITTLFFLGIFFSAFAQMPFHDDSYNADSLRSNIATLEKYATQRGTLKYIPLRFHLVNNAKNEPLVSYKYILVALCRLNEKFAAQNMVFYMLNENGTPFENIPDEALQLDQSTSSASQFMAAKDSKQAINIWIVKDIKLVGSSSLGTTLGIYNFQKDRIYSHYNDFVGQRGDALIHEMGHYFGLRHTYSGWGLSFLEVQNPKKGSIIKINKDNNDRVAECKNGTNCTTSGDLICDTPPDYGIGYYTDVNGKCVEPNFKVIDPCGDTIKILTDNYMGSFYCPSFSYHFSPMQLQLTEVDYFSARRDYLRNNATPNLDKVNGMITYLMPADAAQMPFYNSVSLDWEDVQNATNYILELSQNSSFSLNVQSILCDKSQKTVQNLLPNRKYYWRVIPFNAEIGACLDATAIPFRSFSTSSVLATAESEANTNCSVFPNPASETISILFNSKNTQSIDIQLFDLQGKLLKKQTITQNEATIDVATFAEGVYLLYIREENRWLKVGLRE
jgi:hypothetical protein